MPTGRLGAWALFREALGAEDAPAEWILLAIVILSLLPVALLILDGLASSGGSVEVGQVKIALTAAATARVLTVAPRNVAAGPNIGDSGSEQIIDGLQRARSARIVVVNLEDGHAWWESRLLILCSGAVRLGRPEVIVFTASRHGKTDQFVGWAHPAEIQRRLLEANPVYATGYDRAMGIAATARQDQGLGKRSAALAPKQYIIHPPGREPTELNPFLEEQLLADAVSTLEHPPREISIARLEDLLVTVLHSSAVDRTDLDSDWFKKALRSDEEYVAVTDTGTYVALMTRTEVISEVVLALSEA